jgi:hypothetical protein
MPSIIQFIHPQWEHRYDSHYKKEKYYKKWNEPGKDHFRKFVINKGKYIENDISNDDILLFWCEWEPPSLVEELIQTKVQISKDVYPQYLHYPFLPPLEKIKHYQQNGYQNTDPFVFGKNFKYSICKQDHYPCMRNLEKGSLILFGSCVRSRFVIDTVFVVKDIIRYITPVTEDIYFKELDSDSNIYCEIVLKMSCKEQIEEKQRTRILYIGASYEDTDESLKKMFSFAPSVKYEGIKKGFPRLYLHNNNAINKYFSKWTKGNNVITDNLTQGLKCTSNIPISEIKYLWKIIRDATLENYVLGYNFEMPKEDEIIKL